MQLSTSCTFVLASMMTIAAVMAQGRTWIVDAAGGPNHDFREIGAAVVAAASGDTIDVRPGNYAGFVVDKGINIHGQAGAVVQRGFLFSVYVNKLPAGESLVLQGIDFGAVNSNGLVLIADCQGPVFLQKVKVQAMSVTRAASVHAVASNFGSSFAVDAVTVVDSVVNFDRCTLTGGGGGLRGSTGPGLRSQSSRIAMSRCAVSGGLPILLPVPPSPAVMIQGGSLVFADDGSGILASAPQTPVMDGVAEAVLPATLRSSGGPIAPGIRVILRNTPSLAVDQVQQLRSIDLTADAQQAYALFVGLPVKPFALIGILGDCWFDLAGPLIVYESGIVPASRRVMRSFSLAATTTLGRHFVWQAATFDGMQFVLSNASGYAHTR